MRSHLDFIIGLNAWNDLHVLSISAAVEVNGWSLCSNIPPLIIAERAKLARIPVKCSLKNLPYRFVNYPLRS
jgi:hypothetical protein